MTLPHSITPGLYEPQDQLFLWALLVPDTPTLLGEIRLSPFVADCATFSYASSWQDFALSEDLPLMAGQSFSAGERGSAPGALDDARPDRWGERIIRHVDRPKRLSILEMLLFAGDDRFGALGVSVSAEHYIPRNLGPYPQLRDVGELARAVEDVQAQAPITPAMQRLLQPGVTLGGARPKALLQTDSGPCIIKFSELDDEVDTPLIEHATMTLARLAGIRTADTDVLALPVRHGKKRHALTIQRFDRIGQARMHCLSAKTALRAAGLPEDYSALAGILLRLGHPDRQNAQREELFKRMVFNILMDNTDDHERNHSIMLNFDGYYDLTPAYDMVPSLQNLGYQAMGVGRLGAESSLENALSDINEYGIKLPRAIELMQQVAAVVEHWPAHFSALGVSRGDMELLSASIDRDALRAQRRVVLGA
ncbi:type II toxin-antitoxin system HipA family toxin [Comamonas sp. GB3 AK4-5]|uniref:type II toxin-antitoxin system HipA family toxin n=1 Tax=Comamonas sp. GB3 AK4-5 TaxID=3231487 RepID=UPI00351E3362